MSKEKPLKTTKIPEFFGVFLVCMYGMYKR